MTSLANTLQATDHSLFVAPTQPQTSVRMPREKSPSTITLVPAHERSRYGEQQRPNITGLAGAAGIVALFVAGLLTMNVVANKQEQSRLMVMDMASPQESPPPPPPPKPQQKQVEVKEAPAVIVAPPPKIFLDSPVELATTPTPPKEIIQPSGPPATSNSEAPAGPTGQGEKPSPAPSTQNGGDLSTSMISAPPPRYPVESRRNREQGTVVLRILVDIDGAVSEIAVSQSSGFRRLDHAAMHAVRRWRWSPSRSNGKPVLVRGFVEIPFILQG